MTLLYQNHRRELFSDRKSNMQSILPRSNHPKFFSMSFPSFAYFFSSCCPSLKKPTDVSQPQSWRHDSELNTLHFQHEKFSLSLSLGISLSSKDTSRNVVQQGNPTSRIRETDNSNFPSYHPFQCQWFKDSNFAVLLKWFVLCNM